jgi:hypothetical protein
LKREVLLGEITEAGKERYKGRGKEMQPSEISYDVSNVKVGYDKSKCLVGSLNALRTAARYHTCSTITSSSRVISDDLI